MTTNPSSTVPPTTSGPTKTSPSTAPTTATAPPATAPALEQLGSFGPGDEGAGVALVQQRLEELHFWLGPIDGVYGPLTEQAVFAFQKANGLIVSGEADAAVLHALPTASPLTPMSESGTIVEIDKTRQLLVFAHDGEAVWVLNTSTGTEDPYRHPNGQMLLADTPLGRHTFISQYDGTQAGELGPLYRPTYFHRDGIAIHGYGSVPPRPASHG